MKPSKWIDISIELDPRHMPIWPGNTPLSLEATSSLEAGDPVTDTTLRMSLHTGTHLDAPSHFLRDGDDVESVELDVLNGPCQVVEIFEVAKIGALALEESTLDPAAQRVLLKTDNSTRCSGPFDPDFVGLDLSGAQWLAEHKVELVGIDYLSIQAFDEDDEVHRRLLEVPVTILEGLVLRDVSAGWYELMCLPLRLRGVEAAPARALLRRAPSS